jgi:PAS domain S-box-containing protein
VDGFRQVKKIIGFLELSLGRFFRRLRLGMRMKLILIFIIIKVIPLILLTFIAWNQAKQLAEDLELRTHELVRKAHSVLSSMGEISVGDSVTALNAIAVDNIERMSTDIARDVADFLYARDDDILYLAAMRPDENAYRAFARGRKGRVIKPGKWALAADGKSWVPEKIPPPQTPVPSSNPENDRGYHNRTPDIFEYENLPLYFEISFIDLEGNEKIKVTTSPRMDRRLKNVADRRNTYIRAETYFAELKKLKPGEIYVSDVIGAYVRSRLIGMYNPENAAARGLEFAPEKEAYAGRENPNGRRFEGIIRWATPVALNGKISGYVTFALNHEHIMSFTDLVTPMRERYQELPSAYEGNYAFIWDYQCRNICHPRHHSIYGFNPDTGLPEIPWLEEGVYNDWQASGKSYHDFIKDYPVFVSQSRDKKPAAALTGEGLVGLDGRYLNHAPQCTGWFDLTKEGGSGSFQILWSGIWKTNTAATIPYYTGNYGKSKRGFGFVAIGAGLEDFERPARETEAILAKIISDTDEDLSLAAGETKAAIESNLWDSIWQLSASAGVMIIFVVFVAIWMASVFTKSITHLIAGISRFRAGERQFRFNAPLKDEIGVLADSFDDLADSLVAGVTSPLSILDMNRKIIYMNDKGLEFVEKSLDEVVGKDQYEINPYPENSPFDPIKALNEGREADVLFIPDKKRYVRGTASYLTDKEGKRIGYTVMTADITEIIEEQKTIAEQRSLLNMIFTFSPDLIWYQDINNTYLAVNPRYASLFGEKPENIEGKKLEDVLPFTLFYLHQANDAKAYQARASFYSEEQFTFPDGHEETLDVVRTPIYDDKNQPLGLLGFGRNVSERARIEQELRLTQENLEKAVNDANSANEHKGEFLARMSHEIRTPMNAIIGMTNIIKKNLSAKNLDMKEMQANIRQIEASSQHLLGLLNDILDVSKIEAGKIELSEENVDMLKLARTVESIILPRCRDKKIEFQTNFTMENPLVICDALRLRQVLLNLLGNAVKFTPEDGKIEFAVVQKEKKEGSICFSFIVKDSGIGIAADVLPQLFQPFTQANGQISQRYGGTGLGLVISKSIVQLFGGDIDVQSEPGKGSTFSFELWFAQGREQEEESIHVEDAANRLAGKRALLVDDVQVNRMIAIALLEFTGMSIDEADDGDAALRMFSESPENTYDIIYMDVRMPRMNGYEAVAAIRALDRPDAKSVPIVALTANAFKEDIDKAIKAGMNAHLAKPMETDKVLELTFRLIGSNSEL